jgi:hypothetical protein
MGDRIMAATVVLGCCALAVFLLLQRYTAPACGADATLQKLMPELGTETGLTSLYLLDTQSIGGGLLAGTRQCVVDVAQIRALQPVSSAHWLKVMYSASIDRTTGAVTVLSHVAGPVTPVFTPRPSP